MSFSSDRVQYVKLNTQHWEDYYAMVSQSVVMQWIIPGGHDIEGAQAKFTQSLEENNQHPVLGNYALLDPDTQTFIGVGKMYGDDPSDVETGYIIVPHLWGLGYGSEICARLVKEILRVNGVKRIYGIIDPANIASRKILEKSGLKTYKIEDKDGVRSEYLERII